MYGLCIQLFFLTFSLHAHNPIPRKATPSNYKTRQIWHYFSNGDCDKHSFKKAKQIKSFLKGCEGFWNVTACNAHYWKQEFHTLFVQLFYLWNTKEEELVNKHFQFPLTSTVWSKNVMEVMGTKTVWTKISFVCVNSPFTCLFNTRLYIKNKVQTNLECNITLWNVKTNCCSWWKDWNMYAVWACDKAYITILQSKQ